MKRIIISDDDLTTKLPQILHIKKQEYPKLTVDDLITMLRQFFPLESSKIVGVRTFIQDYYTDFKLQNPNFIILSLKLPVELLITFKDETYLITSNTILQMSFFTLLKQIGSGTYSTVYLCSQKYDKHLYTMKIINKKSLLENGDVSQMVNEIEILKTLRGIVQIPKLYYCFEDSFNVYVVMEYCSNADLFLQLRKSKRYKEEDARIIFIQALWCLTILRQKGIIHRDVKPENFVVDSNGYLKITDFGFAQKLLPNEKTRGLCGSYEYMAPQMILNKQYSFSYDIYALGIMLYELMIGNTPFEGITKENIKTVVESQIKYPQQLSKQVIDLISKLTQRSPEKRLGASNINDTFSHSWLKEHTHLINRIISRKQQSPFYEMNILKQIKIFPSKEKEQKLWGISYNYLTPTFDIEQSKMGPKLEIQGTKKN